LNPNVPVTRQTPPTFLVQAEDDHLDGVNQSLAYGEIRKESTGTKDPHEAERFLRQRLEARDDGNLPTVLSGKKLTFSEWLDWFLEMRSKPPFRAEKTHLQNLRVANLVRPARSQALHQKSENGLDRYVAVRESNPQPTD
jgi:hypothetical protein